MYLPMNDSSFLPASRHKSELELARAVRHNSYVRMALSDGEMVGWIYAEVSGPKHIEHKVLQQSYYASNQTGAKAVKVLKFLHNGLREYAEESGYAIVVSAGSHMDSGNVLARILATDGWDTRGYLAAFKTSHYKE